ncbi:MAG: hypothetical protein KIT58_20500, partial [Planctomycetota bacterium]|nr:hypothetical protein [Planctomycetota bacterium]
MNRREPRGTRAWAALTCLALTGCGAAYYGAALGVVATQRDKKTIDLSFPDAVPTGPVAPSFATARLSTGQVTISRDLSTFNPGNLPGVGQVTRTDHRIEGIDFPAGYGEARSNRDADATLVDGDRLVVRINGDQARELTFAAGDVASTGAAVAQVIRDKVRALTPSGPGVPATAYTLFDASYDPVSRSYLFVSGAPGDASEVVFEPAPRQGVADAQPSAASMLTAARLGLGAANGGIELPGSASVRIVVLNRGTDTLLAGTTVELYLSLDKVLDPRIDLRFDRMTLDEALAVGEARRLTRREGGAPPVDLLREDLRPGLYYVLFSVVGSDERITSNNLIASAPVLVSLPADDPAATVSGPFDPVDIVAARTVSPISVVTDELLAMSVTLTNAGGAVAAPVQVDLDLVLSPDATFDAPGGFADPTGAVPFALRINSDDPTRVVTVNLDGSGTPATVGVAVTGLTVNVTYDPAVHSVNQVAAALQSGAGTILDAFVTGGGDPAQAGSMATLAAAAGVTTTSTGDTFVTTRRVTCAAEDRPLRTPTFVLDG